MTNAAIQLSTEPYDAAIDRPMGRNSAGEGFLRGFLKYADVERLHFWNSRDEPQADLDALLARLGPVDKPVTWIDKADRGRLAEAGALYIPTPEIRRESWARRAAGGRAYSLTGVTHSIADAYVLDEIAGLLSAPLEPWDALVCTSMAGRRAVESLLEGVAGYLQERFGATRMPPAQLVTIPLGVHTGDFRQDPAARTRWRERLGIPHHAPAALHLGRFNIATKLHPGPTGLALGEAARRLGRPVYWILFGGARRAEDEDAFRAAAASFADDVVLCPVESTSAVARDEIVSAADVFVSLSDNVQETFGLTPVEAMAAGLPCVVSDWDGYKDTVRHGVDGFRIRTLTPRPGLGADLMYAYAQRLTGYDRYVGATALFTAVDVGEAADALTALFRDPALRARMGEAGRARARDTFDWRVVIPQYQALWAELARRRAAAPEQPAAENPYRPDPFRMFAAYPTAALAATHDVALARPLTNAQAADMLALIRDEAVPLPTATEALALLSTLADGPRTVAEILGETPPERRPFMERGLLWLAKFGFLRLGG